MAIEKERRRKSVYTDALGERVCLAIATSTIGIKKMVEADRTLPSESTIYLWVQQNPRFAANYRAARSAQADARIEAAQEIAETCIREVKAVIAADRPGAAAKAQALVAAYRLAADVQHRIAAWLKPKKAAGKASDDDGWDGYGNSYSEPIDIDLDNFRIP